MAARAAGLSSSDEPMARSRRRALSPRFDEIVSAPEAPSIVAVDVPIGLPKQSPVKGRPAESLVRAQLGDRKSSVFRIPSRSAVYASVASEPADARERFFHACRIARETSDDGKAFAKQGFYILDKVVEVDTFLRGDPDWAARVLRDASRTGLCADEWRHAARPSRRKRRTPIIRPARRCAGDLLAAAGIPSSLARACGRRKARRTMT